MVKIISIVTMLMFPVWIDLEEGMKDCPECHSELKMESRERIFEHLCRGCNLGITRDCTCYYETIIEDCLFCPSCITCKVCKTGDLRHTRECMDCERIKRDEMREKEKREEYQLFLSNFKSSSPQGKLSFYGKRKLSILAKRKNLRKFSHLTKDQLFQLLAPLVSDQDFPIRE